MKDLEQNKFGICYHNMTSINQINLLSIWRHLRSCFSISHCHRSSRREEAFWRH